MSGIRLSLFALFASLAMTAQSHAASSRNDWVSDLRSGGYVIVFRHGATTSDQKTDAMSNPALDKAGAGERQLNEQGRAQAQSIGRSMRRLGIPVGMVLTSPLQRAVDTGMLMAFREVIVVPDLGEAGPALSAEENSRRAQALRTLVAMHPPADSNLVIVSHKPNLIAAFGTDWSDLREGEASVFEPDGQGGFKLIVRVPADEWAKQSSVSD
jgi:broad specificity phosphatase PhoE